AAAEDRSVEGPDVETRAESALCQLLEPANLAAADHVSEGLRYRSPSARSGRRVCARLLRARCGPSLLARVHYSARHGDDAGQAVTRGPRVEVGCLLAGERHL